MNPRKQDTLVAVDRSVEIDTLNYGGIGVQLSGTWAGTIAFEVTIDGANWRPVNLTPTNSSTQVTSATANGIWFGTVAGVWKFRARRTVVTSGSVVVNLQTDSPSPGGAGGGGSSSGDAQPIGDPVPSSAVPIAAERESDGELAYPNVDDDGYWNVHVQAQTGGGLTNTELRATPVPVSIAIGDDDTLGEIDDSSILGDNDGTVNAHIRGLGEILADVWDAAGNFLRVNVQNATLAVTQSGNWVIAAGSALIGKVGIDQTTPGTTNGVQVNAALPAGNNNIGDVDVVSSALPTGAATLAEQQTQTASLSVLDDWDNAASDGASVSGDAAHDAVDAGEPVKVGAKAVEYGATPTAVAANDRTNLYADRAGVLFAIGGHPDVITLEHSDADGETNVAIITVSSGTRIVVTQIQAVLDEACTVSVGLRVGFATATTPTTTGVVLTHPGVVPGSGVSRGDGSGILGIGADNEDLRITSEAPTGGTLRILVSYYLVAV